MEPMVSDDKKQDAYRLFAQRLNEACDRSGLPKQRGRATELGRLAGVSYKGAGKWLTGEGMPDIGHGVVLANALRVDFNWLYTGRSSAKEALKKEHNNQSRDENMHIPTESYRKLGRIAELWGYLTDDSQDSILERVEEIVRISTKGLPPPVVRLPSNKKKHTTRSR